MEDYAAIVILDIMVQDSAQRLHISAQRIIISLPIAIFSHIMAQLMHISAHIPHILGHIGLMRIMHFMAISHMSMQSCIMHIISADIFMSLFMHIIIVSLHIAIQLQQSSIQRCISCERSIIMVILSRLNFGLATDIASIGFSSFPLHEYVKFLRDIFLNLVGNTPCRWNFMWLSRQTTYQTKSTHAKYQDKADK